MSQSIPTLQIPYYSIVTRLDGSDYKLEFRYSTRAQRFYLNLYTAEDVLLVAGIKLVTGVMLLHYYHHIAGMPSGELSVMATASDQSSPSLLELGDDKRCTLTYFTAAEIANFKAAALV